jgi:hypothetical protein
MRKAKVLEVVLQASAIARVEVSDCHGWPVHHYALQQQAERDETSVMV